MTTKKRSPKAKKPASLVFGGGSKVRPYDTYKCECGREHIQDSGDPVINRWCMKCQKITRQALHKS